MKKQRQAYFFYFFRISFKSKTSILLRFVTSLLLGLGLLSTPIIAKELHSIEHFCAYDAFHNAPPSNRRYLGISSTFSRWPGTIPIAYNPSGAPAPFSNTNTTVNLIFQAFEQWQSASGIRFDYQGLTSNHQDDGNDNLVVIGWGDAGGAQGRAGPRWSSRTLTSLGYWENFDGSVEINQDPNKWQFSSDEAKHRVFFETMTHELGHLIGLGHSDNPDSIMYANPYNNLPYLRADDIAAARALYGDGSDPHWTSATYSIPPTQLDSRIETYFYLCSEGSRTNNHIRQINDADTEQLCRAIYYQQGFAPTQGEWVLLEPGGTAYSSSIKTSFHQYGGWSSYTMPSALKEYPGNWQQLFIVNGKTVARETLTVSTNPSWNRPPTGTLRFNVTQGTAPLTVTATLSASDPENDNLEATWHIPGEGERLAGGTTASFSGYARETLQFNEAGEYTVYVTLQDNASRYSGAGRGYRKLLSQTVTVNEPGGGNASPVINAFSITPNPAQVDQSVSINVDASDPNGDPLTYAWQINGYTSNKEDLSLIFSSVGDYTVNLNISDGKGGSVSRSEILKIIAQASSTATLDVSVNGSGSVSSSPQGINCPSICSADYVLNTSVALTATPQAGYEFSGWSGACSGSQNTCRLTLSSAKQATAQFVASNAPPVINTLSLSPNPAQVSENVFFNADASDPDGDTLSYSWEIGSHHFTGKALQLAFGSANTYNVKLSVSDGQGHTVTRSTSFSVQNTVPKDTARIINISTRCHVQNSPDNTVAGFVIDGTGSKRVLLRAIRSAAEANTSFDLKLDLYRLNNGQASLIDSNDDWLTGTNASSINQLSANLVPDNYFDAALLLDLTPGIYTAIGSPVASSGIGVVSVDDLDTDSNPSSKLVNISGRCKIESGIGNAIAGFVISGEGSLKTLLRGIKSGAETGYFDPSMQLYQIRQTGSTVLDSNNSWQYHNSRSSVQQLSSHYVPNNSTDAAMLKELSAGVYTINAAPNGNSGIGVVGVDIIETTQ